VPTFLRSLDAPDARAGTLRRSPGIMAVLMITIWLALQLPTGILLGRFLERQPSLVPIRVRR